MRGGAGDGFAYARARRGAWGIPAEAGIQLKGLLTHYPNQGVAR